MLNGNPVKKICYKLLLVKLLLLIGFPLYESNPFLQHVHIQIVHICLMEPRVKQSKMHTKIQGSTKIQKST